MDKKKDDVFYACPICSKTYTTKSEARKCAKNIEDHFKEGDIIHFHGNTWRITYISNGIGLERVNDYMTAFAYSKRWQMKACFYARTKFCGDDIKKVDIGRITALKEDLRRRFAAANRLERALKGENDGSKCRTRLRKKQS
jgi:hypothetical protein